MQHQTIIIIFPVRGVVKSESKKKHPKKNMCVFAADKPPEVRASVPLFQLVT